MWAPSPPWGLLGESPRRFRVPRARVYPSTARRKRRVYRFSGGSARTNYAVLLVRESSTKRRTQAKQGSAFAHFSTGQNSPLGVWLLGLHGSVAFLCSQWQTPDSQTAFFTYILVRMPQATQALTLLDICSNRQQIRFAANAKTLQPLHIYRYRGCANCSA